jgi:glutamate-1-semialdehyde aminotransferase
MERERVAFRRRHARSGQLSVQAKRSLLFGVPMNWMTRWPGDHPVFVDRAEGARFRDVDGNEFIDFCRRSASRWAPGSQAAPMA